MIVRSRNIAFLISLIVCAYSRSRSASGWNSAHRKNKYNTLFIGLSGTGHDDLTCPPNTMHFPQSNPELWCRNDLPWDLLLRKRDHVRYHSTNTEECCPSVTQIVQPMGGVAKSGRILELYRDQNSTQSFYQTSCQRGIRGHPCQYIDDAQRKHSVCVQRYSYTYALVREFNSESPWRLDYIRVRTGCSCEIRLKKIRPYRRKSKRMGDFLETGREFE